MDMINRIPGNTDILAKCQFLISFYAIDYEFIRISAGSGC